MSGEKLYNLRAHPAVEPLNKERAWEKLQTLRKVDRHLDKPRKNRSLLFWYSVLTTAACLLLFSYIFTESKTKSSLIQNKDIQQLSTQKTSKENVTDIAPAINQIQSGKTQPILNPKKTTEIRYSANSSTKKSVADSLPEVSQLKQEKLSIMATPSPEIGRAHV